MKTTSLVNKFELVSELFETDLDGVIASDLLSLVMAKGEADNVFVTVQNNLNSVAVASLHEFSCIIFTYGQNVDESVIEKANDNNITLFKTDYTTSEVIVMLKDLNVL